MGGKKKTLHHYAAEFTDLLVKQHLIEHSDSGDTSVVETLYCRACERAVYARAEGPHPGTPVLGQALQEPQTHPTARPADAHSHLNRLGSRCHRPSCTPVPPALAPSASASAHSGSPSIGTVPPPAVGHTSLLPVNPTAISTTTSDLSAQEGATPSTSTGHLSVFPAFQIKTPAVPSEQTSQRFSEASHRVLPGGGLRCSHDFGAGVAGHLGLAMFGVGFGSLALLQSVVDENSCCLLYVVEDQLCDVERAFRAEHLANTRVVREQDADIVLNDQRRFDPAFQFLHKQVCVSHALQRIHWITAISSLFPAASLASLKRAVASLETRSQSSPSLVSRWGFLQCCCARCGCRMHVAGGSHSGHCVFSGTCLLPSFLLLRYGRLKRCRHCWDQHEVSL
ncbi:uncharacterized protein [Symphalangus syndactylus]|uniref:uncharacterized protein isoform X3 n=1 Tax=Symphalangus syndactylus TaxID=9590 RepID=UPI003006B85D